MHLQVNSYVKTFERNLDALQRRERLKTSKNDLFSGGGILPFLKKIKKKTEEAAKKGLEVGEKGVKKGVEVGKKAGEKGVEVGKKGVKKTKEAVE